MIYSKTCEYAIRALVFFARHPGRENVTVSEVSRFSGAPKAYVAKIFRGLARHKILRSQRGPSGGFSLLVPATRLKLAEVVRAMDDPKQSSFTRCVMGLHQCEDQNPCPMHETWKRAKTSMCHILETTTIADLLGVSGRFSSGGKRKKLSRRMREIFIPS